MCWPIVSWAGAWTLPEGETLAVYGFYYSQADRGYDGSGKLTYDPEFSKSESTLYIEHGISNSWMLVGQTGLQSLQYRARSGLVTGQGVGASHLGFQRKIWQNSGQVISLRGSFILAGPGENVPDADLGYGGNGVEMRALYGSNFNLLGKSGFFDAQAGWVDRREFGGPNALSLDLTAGRDIKKDGQLIGQLFYQQTHKGRHGVDIIQSNQSLKAQISWIRPGRKAGKKYQIGLTQTLAGENIVRETGLVFSVWQ